MASALLPFLLSPQHQPTGFLIHDVPVAASFSNPSSFVPVSAGPLGGEFIIRPSRFGGFGSETIDKPEGQWCAYWHEKGGAMESIPRGAPGISEDGNIELTPAHRAFLGNLAGVPQSQAASSQGFHSVQATGMTPVSVEGVMQPIKIGISKGKKKEEAAIIPITQKRSLLDDGEEDDKVGKDTVLLSRSTSTGCLVTITADMRVAKGARIVPPTSSSRKVTIILYSAPYRFHSGPMLTYNIGRSPTTLTNGTQNSQNLPYLIPCRRTPHQRVFLTPTLQSAVVDP